MPQAAWELQAAGCGGHAPQCTARRSGQRRRLQQRLPSCAACLALLCLPPPTTSSAQTPFLHTWQDSPGMGLENMTANAPGSQGGKSERRMLRVVSCVPRGVACMALSRRVRSMMASYLQEGVTERVQQAAGGAGQAGLWLARWGEAVAAWGRAPAGTSAKQRTRKE